MTRRDDLQHLPTSIHHLLISIGDNDAAIADLLSNLDADDWRRLFQSSTDHFVSPLIYRRLKPFSSIVPASVWRDLTAHYFGVVRRNTRLLHFLADRLRWLAEADIPIIVLKGAHLSEAVYESIGLRAFWDVDLLCREADLPRIRRLLTDEGGENGPYIDLQWYLDIDLDLDLEKVWERAVSFRVAGTEALGLCPEHLLIHLCVHLAFHHIFQYAGLRSLCDIREVVVRRGREIDWDRLFADAREWGVVNAVTLCLHLVEDLFETPPPKDAVDCFSPEAIPSAMRDWAVTEIFGREQGPPMLYSRSFCQFWEGKGARDRAGRLVRAVCLPRSEIMQMYPATFESIWDYRFYGLRLVELFRLYRKPFWRMLTGDRVEHSRVEVQNRVIDARRWLVGKD